MKYPLIILAFLTSCSLITEEVEVEKLVRDTVTVERFVDRYFQGIDTVEVIVQNQRVDTVTLTDTDTLIVEKIVFDTVYVVDSVFVIQYVDRVEHIHHYWDTLYIPLGWSTTSVGPYLGSVEEFYNLAYEYRWEFPGGDILVEQWTAAEFPPASRSSYSTQYFDQFILKIKEDLTPDEAYSAILRELAHWQLGKPYTKEPGQILNPDFPWTELKLSDSMEKKKPYLDILFKH